MRHPHLTLALLAASCATGVQAEPAVSEPQNSTDAPEFTEAPPPEPEPAPEDEGRFAEEQLECAERSIEAYNEAESPTPQPLVTAVSCYDSIGLWVKAVKVQNLVNASFPREVDLEKADLLLDQAFDVMQHPAAAQQTEWGRHCLGLQGPSGPATAALQIACARKGDFTAWIVELCGPEESRASLDEPTQTTCSDFDGYLEHLKQRAAAEGR